MEPTVLQVIGGLVLAALVAFIGLVLSQKSALVRIETLLTGANGDNGIVGDVKNLHERQHALADRLHSHDGRLDLHDQRFHEMDRRSGPEDRRASA